MHSDNAELLAKINRGFPAIFWERYKALQPKMREATVSEQERTEFLEMAEQLEQHQTARLKALVTLSQLRKESLETTIKSLGLEPTG